MEHTFIKDNPYELEVNNKKTLVIESIDFIKGTEFHKTGFKIDFKIKKGISPIGEEQLYFNEYQDLPFIEIMTPNMIGTKVYLTEKQKYFEIPKHCVKITISIEKADEYLIVSDLSVL